MEYKDTLHGLSPRQLTRVCTLERVAAWQNLFAASDRARRGKSRRPDVEDWWRFRETDLAQLRDELLSGAWTLGPYKLFTITEPKRREIAAAPFRDRVVHHALCRQLGPVLERRFIARSFSCQVGKGTTAAREVCRRLVNRHRYVLKCDVRKFFPSIDHDILRNKLGRWIACPGALRLADRIIRSFQSGLELPPVWFQGDDLLDAASPRGLPIGNLTSQLWGNYYLDDLDHWVTETAQHGAYLRYTDDFLVFGDEKGRLEELRKGIEMQLARVRLRLAISKSRLLTVAEGVPFCGLLFARDASPRILGATKRRFFRRYAHLRASGRISELSKLVSAWFQFSREGNAAGLRRSFSRADPHAAIFR